MAKKNLELQVYVDGPIHLAFKELAKECMKQGVQINQIKFEWLEHSSIASTNRSILTKVYIDSSCTE